MIVRTFEQADFPMVKAIYQQGIDTGNATFQQQAKDWEEWDSSLLPECRLVAELEGEIVGWAALSPVSSRCVYAGVAEVSVYVSTAAAGQGIGKRLLQHLVTASEVAGIWTLQAGIFPENTASIAIHEKNGFRKLGVRQRLGKMKGQWRDVVFMERRSNTVGV
ncbi:GNAT family N-acetyltransferase [Saccharospirillum salsuginis]|nr:GNAT family N-acetyltransferase [Saccharospirillum salsuginis]